jgi:transposase
LRRDIEAVRNAIKEPWSNGQTEGQINLKTAVGWFGFDENRALSLA